MTELTADYWSIATAIGTLLLAAATFLTVKAVYAQMKHDRLVKEMENLVAPLHSKINYDQDKTWGDPYIFMNGTSMMGPIIQEYSTFWNPILLNKYLGVSYLRDAIDNYLANKSRIAGDNRRDDNYIAAEGALFNAITDRYSELTNEIDQLEDKKRWQLWR